MNIPKCPVFSSAQMGHSMCVVCGVWVCQYQRINCRVVKCGKWCVDYKQVRIPDDTFQPRPKPNPSPIPGDLLGFLAAASQRCFLESPCGDLFGITVYMQSIFIDTVFLCVRGRSSVRYFPVSHKRLGIRVSCSVDDCKCHSWSS